MENKEELLIGKLVHFSRKKGEIVKGRVIDKIQMKETPSDVITITGYLIEDYETGELKPIPYWRIVELYPENEEDNFNY